MILLITYDLKGAAEEYEGFFEALQNQGMVALPYFYMVGVNGG